MKKGDSIRRVFKPGIKGGRRRNQGLKFFPDNHLGPWQDAYKAIQQYLVAKVRKVKWMDSGMLKAACIHWIEKPTHT